MWLARVLDHTHNEKEMHVQMSEALSYYLPGNCGHRFNRKLVKYVQAKSSKKRKETPMNSSPIPARSLMLLE